MSFISPIHFFLSIFLDDDMIDFCSQMSTNLFILCDKPKDTNLISISFLGREPPYASIWSTEFDYCWYEIPMWGKYTWDS